MARVLRPALRFPAAAVLAERAAARAGRAAVGHAHDADRASPTCRAACRSSRSYEEMQRAFPGAQMPAVVVVQAADVTPRRCARRSPRSRALALAARWAGPIDGTVNPRHDLASIEMPLAGNGADSRSMPRCGRCVSACCPRRSGACRARASRSPGQTAGTEEFNAVTSSTGRSCSRSCSVSLSCCC